MDKFDGEVAIVTGGASGIGRALCEELGRRHAMVVVADITFEGALRVASAISRSGGTSEAAHLDVACADDVKNLIERTASRYGQLDYMFNNAGIAIAGEVRVMTPEHVSSFPLRQLLPGPHEEKRRAELLLVSYRTGEPRTAPK